MVNSSHSPRIVDINYPLPKMAFSYSGIVNYGKATLPTVESWGTNLNILKDPPRSVHTRKIDKVGETSAITTTIDESGDRFCEAINYYARGQNPMVSVSYGQGQKLNSLTSRGEAFLPYRVARDGAFRPPIWRQEDLIPLSRLPRVWTEVSSQPYKPIFTKRMMNCGTAENTREVKSNLLQVACASAKTVATYPDMNQPDAKPTLIRDPLMQGQLTAPKSCNSTTAEIKQRSSRGPILLGPSRPRASGRTNIDASTVSKEANTAPVKYNRLHAGRQCGVATTNIAAPMTSTADTPSMAYSRLPNRASRGSFASGRAMPNVNVSHSVKNLLRVR